MSTTPRRGWIGVDLDGTLADDTEKPYRPHVVGAPIPAMIVRVKAWIAGGFEVRVMTARVCDDEQDAREEIIKAIQDWTHEHIGVRLKVTNQKDYDLIELWDDRAVQIERNTGRLVGFSTKGLG